MKLSEKQIQECCDDFLRLDGWRVFKTDLPHLRGLGVQEKGMPDRLYIRYANDGIWVVPDLRRHGSAEALWIEWKRRDSFSKKQNCWLPTKASQAQHDWHAEERARGALVWVAGEDFEASPETFAEFYAKSGLQRKKVSMGAVKK